MAERLLELRAVSRVFGGIRALDGVDLPVESGTIVGLIGPNGAGKTTVINVISGLLQPSSGEVMLDATPIHGAPPYRIAWLGVTRTYQNVRLFRDLSVLENVIVGQHARRPETLLGRLAWLPSARRESVHSEQQARELLETVGLSEQASAQAGSLPYGDQRRLEIARALATRPRLLLLDEPAAGMPFAETARLLELIRSLPARGVTVLLVEHNMHLVMNVCDRVAVLNFGRKIADDTPAAVSADPAVIEAYLGADDAASAS